MAYVALNSKVNPMKSIECDICPILLISTIRKLLEAKISDWNIDAIG